MFRSSYTNSLPSPQKVTRREEFAAAAAAAAPMEEEEEVDDSPPVDSLFSSRRTRDTGPVAAGRVISVGMGVGAGSWGFRGREKASNSSFVGFGAGSMVKS